ncbi:ankyrin repeat family protein, partial [Elysia marginata]
MAFLRPYIIPFARSQRLINAVNTGDLYTVETEIPKNYHVNQLFEAYHGNMYRGGTTVMSLAIDRSDRDILCHVASLGANPFIKSNGHNIFFQIAGSRKITREIQEMVLFPGNNGEHLNDIDSRGNTPLHVAVLANNTSAVELLLRMGNTIRVSTFRNHCGETPLTMSLKCGCDINIVFMLIDYAHRSGESLYTTDKFGYTPLDLAQGMNRQDIVAAILNPKTTKTTTASACCGKKCRCKRKQKRKCARRYYYDDNDDDDDDSDDDDDDDHH